jgi:two-component system, cell cycle sensor histidine kinase and response regulator CckA
MREVASRALEVVEEEAIRHGLRFEDLTRGLPGGLAQRNRRDAWVDWDDYAEILARFERATSPRACVLLGRAATLHSAALPIQRIARLAIDPIHLYRVGLQWQLPLLIHNVVVHYRKVTSRRLDVELSIPPHFREARAFFRVALGALEMLPTICGLPIATIEVEVADHHARYAIDVPRRRRSRPVVILRNFFRGRALRELERQVEEIHSLGRERARVDEALRQRERMLSNLIANLSGVVYRCRAEDWAFEFASERSFELTGYRPVDLVSQRISTYSLVHPDDAEALRAKREASLRAHQPASNEYRMYSRSGELRWVLDVAQGIYDADGHVVGMEGFITDVTARKHLEEALSHAMRVESIGRLAGGIAHDFNNLLTVILASSDLALLRLPDGHKAREHVEQIDEAARRAAALTRQLLAFARKQIVQPRVVDVNALIAGMDALLRRSLREDIEMHSVLAPDAWRVEIDPGQFEQVLLNLAVNARDAMPDGGRLTIETANLVVEECTASLPGLEPGPYAMVSVTDTGRGMSATVRDHAFEPFFTTKGVGQGTGLGLASSQGIVLQARGHIFLVSEPDRGTSVRVYLPRASGPAHAPASDESGEVPSGRRETVLVVEDHDMLRELVVGALVGHGYVVLAAASGIEALEQARRCQGTIDLLLTDVVMPHMGGLELAGKLLAERRGVPVLYMSGYSEKNVLREHAADSAASFLAKPFTPADLARRVRKILDGAGSNEGERRDATA